MAFFAKGCDRADEQYKEMWDKSINDPDRNYTMNYLDMIVVPASLGKYRIRNIGNQPVVMHKTLLKDGFQNE